MPETPFDRAIIFNGVELPVEMRGISVLEKIVPLPEKAADWLWRLGICVGVEKSSTSSRAREACTLARDLMLEQRSNMMKGLKDRFPDHSAEQVYAAWMKGLTTIIDLSNRMPTSVWSAPLLPGEKVMPPEKVLRGLENFRAQALEEPDET